MFNYLKKTQKTLPRCINLGDIYRFLSNWLVLNLFWPSNFKFFLVLVKVEFITVFHARFSLFGFFTYCLEGRNWKKGLIRIWSTCMVISPTKRLLSFFWKRINRGMLWMALKITRGTLDGTPETQNQTALSRWEGGVNRLLFFKQNYCHVESRDTHLLMDFTRIPPTLLRL
jgi:hypothetical protein